MRAVDLRRVETGLVDAPDLVGEGPHQLLDLVGAQRVRHEPLVGIGHRRRRHHRAGDRPVAGRPGVVHLGEARRALGVDHLGPPAQRRDGGLVEELDAGVADGRERLAVPVGARSSRPGPSA